MIQAVRAAHKNDVVLVLDAGDSITGDREPAKRSQGATSIAAMNRMGYDAIVLGPADLSLGPDLIEQRIQEAKFAVLAADVTVAATKKPVAAPYTIKEVGGRRIAIIGLSGAPSINGFTVADGFDTVRELMGKLRGEAEAVILLSHDLPDVNERIANEIPGIAAIIEGGIAMRGQPWISRATGAPIYHADTASPGHAGRFMGLAELTIEAGQRTHQSWRGVPLGPEVRDDPAMAAWVRENY